MANFQPVFVLLMDEAGNRTWHSKLPVHLLNLALDCIKLDLLQGRIKEANSLVTPTNGETQAVSRIKP